MQQEWLRTARLYWVSWVRGCVPVAPRALHGLSKYSWPFWVLKIIDFPDFNGFFRFLTTFFRNSFLAIETSRKDQVHGYKKTTTSNQRRNMSRPNKRRIIIVITYTVYQFWCLQLNQLIITTFFILLPHFHGNYIKYHNNKRPIINRNTIPPSQSSLSVAEHPDSHQYPASELNLFWFHAPKILQKI